MNLTAFLRSRPCLEELDGFLHALGQMAGDPTIDPSGVYTPLTTDQLQEAKVYRDRLLKGQVVPYRSHLYRAWDYQFGRPPRRKPGRHPPSDAQSLAASSRSVVSDLPAGRGGNQQTYLVAKPRW
jgi:hypothetical protein